MTPTQMCGAPVANAHGHTSGLLLCLPQIHAIAPQPRLVFAFSAPDFLFQEL